MLRQMNEPRSSGIGPGGRWFIFGGVPALFIFVIECCSYEYTVRKFGEEVSPYLALGGAGIIFIIGLIAYDYVPKRLIIPIGVAGWILTFLFVYWYLNCPHAP